MFRDIVVFDFETTGLDHANDRVIEMAAIRVKDGKVVTEFSTIVRFDGTLDPKITQITGITPEEVKNGMDPIQAFTFLQQMMSDPNTLLVAHNAIFDVQFLYHELNRHLGVGFPPNPILDTLTLAREWFTYPHKLVDMSAKLGIKLENAHRALADVFACYEVLTKLMQMYNVMPYVNRIGYLSKFPKPSWNPPQTSLFPQVNMYQKSS